MILGRNYDPAIKNGGKWLLSDIAGEGFNVLYNTWYVSSLTGNDSGSGQQSSPFGTITKAVSVAGNYDTIVVGPGSYNEAVTVTQVGLSILGVGTSTNTVKWTSATDTSTVAINASSVEVAGFKFTPPAYTASAATTSIALSNANYAHIHDNRFQGQTGSYNAIYSAVCNSDNVIIENNDFEYLNTASHGAAVYCLEAGGLSYSDWEILNNKFSSCVRGVYLNGRVCLVQGNHFAYEGVNSSGTLAGVTTDPLSLYGVSGVSSGGNLVHGNYLGGTYSAAGGHYYVGATGDDWAGNFNIAGITTANPS